MTDLLKKIKKLLSSDATTLEKYNQVSNYSYDIFRDLVLIKVYKIKNKKYEELEEYFQKYMYEWNVLGVKRIPFEHWSDIPQEGLEVLAEMVQSENLDYRNNPKFRPFCGKIAIRISELKKCLNL
jgi:SepF-like predicted cell division protein (DUF552 family)